MNGWPDWSTLRLRPRSFEPPDSAPAVGYVDEVGLVLEEGMPRGWFIRGWTALTRGWSGLGELRIILVGSEASFVATPAREPREDVMRSMADPTFVHSGFRALIPLAPLPDDAYRLAIEACVGDATAVLETATVFYVRNGQAKLAPVDPPERLLHVVHVPKTAGTSLGALLQHAFGDDLAQHYGPRLLLRAGSRCIVGHNYASNFLRFAPELQLAMWFRDPVERVVSEYFHWRRNPDTHPLQGEDLLSFARRNTMVNVHRRCLDGVPLSRIDCVGITEQFEASVALFSRVFKLAPAALPALNVNADKAVGAAYELPESLRAEIARANAADYALYAQARQRFRQLCREYDVNLQGAA